MQADSGVIKHAVSKRRYLSALKLSTVLKQKKSKEYSTLILTFLALIIFGVFAINPTLTTIVQLRKQLTDSQALDQKLNEKVTALQKLQKEYDALSPDLPLVEAALPVLPETPTLVAKIQALVKSHNLSVTEIKIADVPYTKEGVPQGTTGSSVTSFQVKGNFSDISALLSEAVSIDRLMTISEVNIVRDPDNRDIISATIGFKNYFDLSPL